MKTKKILKKKFWTYSNIVLAPNTRTVSEMNGIRIWPRKPITTEWVNDVNK